MLASLFEMDGLETSEEYSTTTDPAVKHFKSTVQKKEGRYFVNLPWKEEHQPLPTNEGPAKQQVKSLIQRLKKQPKILQGYHELITDHLARGFVEEVSRRTIESFGRCTHHSSPRCDPHGQSQHQDSSSFQRIIREPISPGKNCVIS